AHGWNPAVRRRHRRGPGLSPRAHRPRVEHHAQHERTTGQGLGPAAATRRDRVRVTAILHRPRRPVALEYGAAGGTDKEVPNDREQCRSVVTPDIHRTGAANAEA